MARHPYVHRRGHGLGFYRESSTYRRGDAWSFPGATFRPCWRRLAALWLTSPAGLLPLRCTCLRVRSPLSGRAAVKTDGS